MKYLVQDISATPEPFGSGYISNPESFGSGFTKGSGFICRVGIGDRKSSRMQIGFRGEGSGSRE